MTLCKCAMDLEWTEAMYGMEHHPECGDSLSAKVEIPGADAVVMAEVPESTRWPKLSFTWRKPMKTSDYLAGADRGMPDADRTVYPPDSYESDEALLAECERVAAFYDVRIHPNTGMTATGPTGEPFGTLAIGGAVKEGASAKLCATSESVAREYFLNEFRLFCQRTIGMAGERTLYWREKPNLLVHSCTCQDYVRATYQVWARCLISTKPILPATESSSSASR